MNSSLIFPSELIEDRKVILFKDRAQKIKSDYETSANIKLKIGSTLKLRICGLDRIIAEPTQISEDRIELKIIKKLPKLPRNNLSFIVAIPRPQAIKRILQSATLCGVEKIYFFRSDNTQKSYLQSKELTSEKYNQEIAMALEQAWDTVGPEIFIFKTFSELQEFQDFKDKRSQIKKYFCHTMINNECSELVVRSNNSTENENKSVIAIGPEKGWSSREVDWFLSSDFQTTNFGERILRVDTAVLFAIGYFSSR